jgi:hypothetical protein
MASGPDGAGQPPSGYLGEHVWSSNRCTGIVGPVVGTGKWQAGAVGLHGWHSIPFLQKNRGFTICLRLLYLFGYRLCPVLRSLFQIALEVIVIALAIWAAFYFFPNLSDIFWQRHL